MNKQVRTTTPAIDKAVSVFDFLSIHKSATFSDIFQGTGLPKSTASSLLGSLVAHGLLRQDKNKFSLGMRLYEYGKVVENVFDISKLAQSHLGKLRDETGLTCHLGVLEGSTAIYLLKLESPGAVIVRSWVGKRLSLYSSGLGKSLLAWLPENQVDALLPEDEFVPSTPKSITSKSQLKKELKEIRKKGWAFDDEEDSIGVFCIAVPIFNSEGHVVAAISASGVAFQVTKDRIPSIVEKIMATAQLISEKVSNPN